jgi:hypothetical protein
VVKIGEGWLEQRLKSLKAGLSNILWDNSVIELGVQHGVLG